MQFPGENLIIRLWDSVEKLSIGALQPYQMKRLAKAKQANEVEQILHEHRIKRTKSDLQLVDQVETISTNAGHTLSAVIEHRNREETNVLNSINHAYIQLSNEGSDVTSSATLNEDWLHRWYSYASKVSNDELQQLWGKLLAGEVRRENSISYRMMDFIDKLTAREIDEITLILSLVEKQNRIIIRGCDKSVSFLEKNGIDSHLIQKYTDLAVLASSTTGVVNVSSKLDFKQFEVFQLIYGNDLIELRNTDKGKDKKSLIYYSLGENGQALLDLSNYLPNYDYLDELQRDFVSNGIEIQHYRNKFA
ncbi:DUF2806 domain-containing protein [Vibrio cholerae]|uniref:DUF2806 domain-containing protein n=1 Tax=Vibrio cholerae TaxID=666 RepID=UPI00115AE9EC|nr:DUF2806 domain-containing protein [Vibrio cholerae]TQP45250.1 DUF2806 domain-containing protein [Vibrio cholerae]TQP84166.1 DUF2806 domain-containing protein [Vibrio cholerae]